MHVAAQLPAGGGLPCQTAAQQYRAAFEATARGVRTKAAQPPMSGTRQSSTGKVRAAGEGRTPGQQIMLERPKARACLVS